MTDNQINAIVSSLYGEIVDACDRDAEAVLGVVAGIFCHAMISFDIPNELAHELVALLLAQREDYGDWVSFEDYTALRARLDAVEKDRDAIGRDLNRAKYGEPDFAWSTHLAVLDETIARAERAEAALATARRDALEEAAKEAVDILETMQTCSIGTAQDRVPAAIRALANEAET